MKHRCVAFNRGDGGWGTRKRYRTKIRCSNYVKDDNLRLCHAHKADVVVEEHKFAVLGYNRGQVEQFPDNWFQVVERILNTHAVDWTHVPKNWLLYHPEYLREIVVV